MVACTARATAAGRVRSRTLPPDANDAASTSSPPTVRMSRGSSQGLVRRQRNPPKTTAAAARARAWGFTTRPLSTSPPDHHGHQHRAGEPVGPRAYGHVGHHRRHRGGRQHHAVGGAAHGQAVLPGAYVEQALIELRSSVALHFVDPGRRRGSGAAGGEDDDHAAARRAGPAPPGCRLRGGRRSSGRWPGRDRPRRGSTSGPGRPGRSVRTPGSPPLRGFLAPRPVLRWPPGPCPDGPELRPVPPAGECRMALSSRFATTWWTRSGSPSATSPGSSTVTETCTWGAWRRDSSAASSSTGSTSKARRWSGMAPDSRRDRSSSWVTSRAEALGLAEHGAQPVRRRAARRRRPGSRAPPGGR